MKKIINTLNLAAMMLLLAGVMISCGKEEEMIDIQLEYVKCPCDHDTMTVTYNLERKNILMIDISNITENEEDKIK